MGWSGSVVLCSHRFASFFPTYVCLKWFFFQPPLQLRGDVRLPMYPAFLLTSRSDLPFSGPLPSVFLPCPQDLGCFFPNSFVAPRRRVFSPFLLPPASLICSGCAQLPSRPVPFIFRLTHIITSFFFFFFRSLFIRDQPLLPHSWPRLRNCDPRGFSTLFIHPSLPGTFDFPFPG